MRNIIDFKVHISYNTWMTTPEAPRPGMDQAQLIDTPRTPELWRPNFGVVVISGKPGAGTSSLAKELAIECGIPNDLFKAGDAVRELAGNTKRAPGYIDRQQEIDQLVDERVASMVRGANLLKPAIAEAQIGAVTALQTQKEMESQNIYPSAPIVRILVWARAEERYKRLYEAAKARGEDVSLHTIRENTMMRERGDIAHWKEMYTAIGQDNPLEKGARDADGKRIYNLEFDNSNYAFDQTFKEVMDTLISFKFVEPRMTFPRRNPAAPLA